MGVLVFGGVRGGAMIAGVYAERSQQRHYVGSCNFASAVRRTMSRGSGYQGTRTRTCGETAHPRFIRERSRSQVQ